jgi:hypothetical protein
MARAACRALSTACQYRAGCRELSTGCEDRLSGMAQCRAHRPHHRSAEKGFIMA